MSQQLVRTREGDGVVSRMPLPSEAMASTNDPQIASMWLEAARREGHLVAPGNSVPILPEGAGVVFSRIQIRDLPVLNDRGFPDRTDSTEVYQISGTGRWALYKGPLDEIGRAYGLDFPPELTKEEPFNETDERHNHPYCRKVTVQARYKDFDGSWKYLPPLTKEIDLRDDAPEVELIFHQQEKKALKDLRQNASPEERQRALREGEKKARIEIAGLRKNIRAHAQTKARLMVIGTLVRRSYKLQELQKPFFVFKYVFTWKSDNPEVQMYYAKRLADQQLGVNAALYEGQPAQQVTGGHVPEQHPPAHIDVQPEEPSWEITVGEFKGRAINDPEVPIEALFNLANYFKLAYEANNFESDAEALEFIEAEIERRNPSKEQERGSIDEAARQVSASKTDSKTEKTKTKTAPTEVPTMPFGEHKGKYFDDSSIPPEELEFVRDWAIGAISQKSGDEKLQAAAIKAAVEVELKRRGLPKKEY